MEKMRKVDSVVKRSIADALVELMAEKDFESITITEIASRAQVARVSFYRNFSGKADVLRQNAQYKTEMFLKTLEPGLRQRDPRAYVIALLEHMRDNREVIGLMMDSHLMDIIREEFDRAFDVDDPDWSISAKRRFLSGGLYNLFYGWARAGYEPDASVVADFMGEMVGNR